VSTSLADLDAADWLDAEYMIVVNQDGTQHHYARVGGEMMPLAPIHNPAYVAESDPMETLAADVAYWAQSLSEIGNPPEMVFEQGESIDTDHPIDKDRRFVRDFLMDPATIVFLDDVANEYGVEDPAFFGAMVATIIYREVAHPRSLQFAGAPILQRFYDGLEANAQGLGFHVAQLFRLIGVEINEGLDGDPSAGIGGLSSKAVRKIEEDAENKGITLYFPHLGFDMPRRIEYADSSEQQSVVIPIGGSLAPKYLYQPEIYPPSNIEHGVGRSVIPRFADRGLRGWRERHEPNLGYLATEVWIAMQSTEYQDIIGSNENDIEEQRIAFLIANHANRSRIPAERDYDPQYFSEDTENEIQWARDFMDWMDEIRRKIQIDAQDD